MFSLIFDLWLARTAQSSKGFYFFNLWSVWSSSCDFGMLLYFKILENLTGLIVEEEYSLVHKTFDIWSKFNMEDSELIKSPPPHHHYSRS